MTILQNTIVYLLLLTTFNLKGVLAQSLGAREASILASHWNEEVISMEDRLLAIERINNGRNLPTSDVLPEFEFLSGLAPLETTLNYLQKNLDAMSAEEQFWISRNLLPRLFVVDSSNAQLHDIVDRLLGSSSDSVHFQTVHTLLRIPLGSGDNYEFCRRIRQGRIGAQLGLLDSAGRGHISRRLLYRIQRALGPNELIEKDVLSCLQHLSKDSEGDSEYLAEAIASAATMSEFPLDEAELVKFAATLYEPSEERAIVELVRNLAYGRSDLSLSEIARRTQYHTLYIELLEKGKFARFAEQSTVSKLLVEAAFLNDDAPPNVRLLKYSGEPFQEVKVRSSPPKWIRTAREARIASLQAGQSEISNDETPVVLLGAIDGQSLEHGAATILKSDNQWHRLYHLESLFLIQADLGQNCTAVLKNGTRPWYVRYLIVHELSSPNRSDDAIEPELLISLLADDRSPYFVLTRRVLSLAKKRQIQLKGTAIVNALDQHVCPDIRREFRALER
ncbi:MAG: hypothetical protein JNL58_32000 [Planctomyces sp.]|nr:hypothetical protein [Planctomyces sp.]